MNKCAELIATCFFLGKFKYAPGTIGALVAFPLSYFIAFLVISQQLYLPLSYNLQLNEVVAIFLILIFTNIILFVIGIWASSLYIKDQENYDPPEIIIDELVGQMLVIILTFPAVLWAPKLYFHNYLNSSMSNFVFFFLLPFISFRFFDIVKPWPIRWLEQKMKTGLGVMLDDIVASIMSVVIIYALSILFSS